MAAPVTGRLKKMKETLVVTGKILAFFFCLFCFICSLSFLSDSFRILGGKNIGSLFSNSDLLKNPVVGVMIGVLVTVLVQSSSTSTSIIVGLVAAGAPVKEAVPMIMGANIGTSVTNILVALTQAGDREQFRRAFACANVHDMFNWLSAFILLILETLTGYLETVTSHLVDHMHGPANNNATVETVKSKSPQFLKVLTKPVTEVVVRLDKAVLKGWAINDPAYHNATILKHGCELDTDGRTVCSYLLAYLGPEGYDLSESLIGLLLLFLSLVMLCTCMIGMVKILNSLLGPRVKEMIQNVINADIPVRGLGWLTGYLAMLFGALITILVQSSSVFTSTLTPLAGAGLVNLERAYPMTLGSNIGTTTTSLLASFAAGGNNLREANQIALVHLFFNVTGILMFYPIPFMRWPISIARVLGAVTSQYRWFAVVYLSFMFFILPTFMFCLSLAGPVPLYLFLVPAVGLIVATVVVNLLQTKMPHWLPPLLRSWDFLPLPLHSMEPWDRLVMKLVGLCACCRRGAGAMPENGVAGVGGGAVNKPSLESPFPSVGYNRLSTVPSAVSMSGICMSSVRVVKDGKNPRQEEEYNLLLNCGSQSPSPKNITPRGSI